MTLSQSILTGDRLALARLLTKEENDTAEGRAALADLFAHTGKAHLAGGRHEPRDRAERRGLARAVAAENGDDLSLADRERDTVESLHLAVASLDAIELEQRWHQCPFQ